MSKVYAFVADGTEEVELLTVVDLLRRGKVDVEVITINKEPLVVSSHKVKIVADDVFEHINFDDGDALFIPGGVPGTPNLEAHEGLKKLIQKYYDEGKLVTAICAAPSILGHMNILNGRNATCFPGYEEDLYGANVTGGKVEQDGNVITAKGLGAAIDLGLQMLKVLVNEETSNTIGKKIQYL